MARDAGVTEFLAKADLGQRTLRAHPERCDQNPRPFIKTKTYWGPDRRRNNTNSNYIGPERRKGGKADVIRQQPPARQGPRVEVSGAKTGMSARKDTSPSVATFADHEVITPANPLRKAIAQAPDGKMTIRWRVPRRRWRCCPPNSRSGCNAECERLETARQEVARQGLTEKTHAELSRAAVAEALAGSDGYQLGA